MLAVPHVMTSDDLGPLSQAAAGKRIAYGAESQQFGELRLPAGAGPHPVLVNVHGGVWLAEYGIEHSRAQALALEAAGFAVWNLEYRRIGHPGGGWPGTFLDVSAGTDYVRELAKHYPLDLTGICLMGHSAGGQLALWLSARHKIAAESPLRVTDPLTVRGVVALAPATELPTMFERRVHDGVVGRLIGGSPQEFPDRYASVTPAFLAPLGVPQTLIVGAQDADWGWNSKAYLAAARAAGDRHVSFVEIEDAGHFELIAPQSTAWPTVVAAVRQLVD